VRSQSTIQRLLRRQIKKNTPYNFKLVKTIQSGVKNDFIHFLKKKERDKNKLFGEYISEAQKLSKNKSKNKNLGEVCKV
jgi:hypothetical protein